MIYKKKKILRTLTHGMGSIDVGNVRHGLLMLVFQNSENWIRCGSISREGSQPCTIELPRDSPTEHINAWYYSPMKVSKRVRVPIILWNWYGLSPHATWWWLRITNNLLTRGVELGSPDAMLSLDDALSDSPIRPYLRQEYIFLVLKILKC